MTKYGSFDIEEGICYTYTHISVAIKWLKEKKNECGGKEVLRTWMEEFYKSGNSVCVEGKTWTCEDCLSAINEEFNNRTQ